MSEQDNGASAKADRAFAAAPSSPQAVSPVPASIPSAARTWMREPCGPCPYSRVNTLWLHPERAQDFANMASNPYNDFPCHKTADLHEDEEGHGEYVAGRKSLTCNGFLSLQCSENGRSPDGFEPHPDAFGDTWEMVEHHEEHWEDQAQAIEARRAATLGAVHVSAVGSADASTSSVSTPSSDRVQS